MSAPWWTWLVIAGAIAAPFVFEFLGRHRLLRARLDRLQSRMQSRMQSRDLGGKTSDEPGVGCGAFSKLSEDVGDAVARGAARGSRESGEAFVSHPLDVGDELVVEIRVHRQSVGRTDRPRQRLAQVVAEARG